MDLKELVALRARFLAAKVNKHVIGAAASHVAALEKKCGPMDFKGLKHSPAHLLALVDKAIHMHRHPPTVTEKVKPVQKVEVKAPAPKVEVKTVAAEPKTSKKADPK